MPAKNNRVQYHFYLTTEQAAAFEAALALSNLDKSAFIREAIGDRVGSAWPENMPERNVFTPENNPRKKP